MVQEAEKDLIICFAHDGITLKLGEDIVFEKSGEKLKNLKEGIEWVRQLDKEVAHKLLTRNV